MLFLFTQIECLHGDLTSIAIAMSELQKLLTIKRINVWLKDIFKMK
mgnify:CR=1 FL=1